MALIVDVPRPARDAPSQVELCGVQWLLEEHAEGTRCVAMDGRVLYEGVLGLPPGDCRLQVEASAPHAPIELRLSTDLVLAPGGGVRGWVALPLVLRLRASPSAAPPLVLVELDDPELRSGWREGEGYHHPFRAAFAREPRALPGKRRFWLRAFLRNLGATVAHPRRVRLPLAGADLVTLRGLAVGPKLEWTFGAGGGVQLEPLPAILQPDFRRFGGTAS